MENQILTNLDNEKLLDTFSGELLDGKIQVQSNRGYLSDTNKPQQDAVLSIVKNDKCFLNIV
ncbi:MAG: hypothetical protein IJ093_03620, partial [Bacilli bacterium]|nr:hypothetical protein [Bacilli bacterium]